MSDPGLCRNSRGADPQVTPPNPRHPPSATASRGALRSEGATSDVWGQEDRDQAGSAAPALPGTQRGALALAAPAAPAPATAASAQDRTARQFTRLSSLRAHERVRPNTTLTCRSHHGLPGSPHQAGTAVRSGTAGTSHVQQPRLGRAHPCGVWGQRAARAVVPSHECHLVQAQRGRPQAVRRVSCHSEDSGPRDRAARVLPH